MFKRHIYFAYAFCVSVFLLLALLFLMVIYGNHQLFLLFNGNAGKLADTVFYYFTQTGEVAPWIIALVYILWKHKKQWKLLLLCFAFSTVLVQVTKNIIPNNERPTKALATKKDNIHTVNGVALHSYFSFPSGHTTTAFTIFLLACIIIPNKTTVVVGSLYAVGVAYSRIYLAQHFPADIAGGIVCAMLAVLLSLFLYQRKSI